MAKKLIWIWFKETNSGGSAWLDEEQHKALKDNGWIVKNKGELIEAWKQFKSKEDAIAEWELLTRENASEQGCDCCGAPYNFLEETNEQVIWILEQGKYPLSESISDRYADKSGGIKLQENWKKPK